MGACASSVADDDGEERENAKPRPQIAEPLPHQTLSSTLPLSSTSLAEQGVHVFGASSVQESGAPQLSMLRALALADTVRVRGVQVPPPYHVASSRSIAHTH